MKELKKFANALVSTLLAIALVFQATPAIATEVDSKEPISRYSTDPEDVIASCAGAIPNGAGTLQCSMTFGNFYATVQARSSYNNGISGSIDCYIEFPDGTQYALGTMHASNGATTPVNFHICPYGNYKFIYDANVEVDLEVQGYIFD